MVLDKSFFLEIRYVENKCGRVLGGLGTLFQRRGEGRGGNRGIRHWPTAVHWILFFVLEILCEALSLLERLNRIGVHGRNFGNSSVLIFIFKNLEAGKRCQSDLLWRSRSPWILIANHLIEVYDTAEDPFTVRRIWQPSVYRVALVSSRMTCVILGYGRTAIRQKKWKGRA